MASPSARAGANSCRWQDWIYRAFLQLKESRKTRLLGLRPTLDLRHDVSLAQTEISEDGAYLALEQAMEKAPAPPPDDEARINTITRRNSEVCGAALLARNPPAVRAERVIPTRRGPISVRVGGPDVQVEIKWLLR